MEKKKISKDWRYVLIKVVDRIEDRSLTPTLLSFVEQVFPKGYAKEEVLEKLQNRTLRWKERILGKVFYFNFELYRIDVSRRRKNTWDINFLPLFRKENGEIKSRIVPTSIDIYTNEAIAHSLGLIYWSNQSELYPMAGIVTDLFVQIEPNSKSYKKSVENEVKVIRKRIEQPPFPSYEGDSNFIFISYSHEDKNIVYQQLVWLHNLGFNIWYDEGIPPTSRWLKILPKKILDSSLFMLFLSKNSIISENVSRELSYSSRHDKTILPIYLEELTLPGDFEFILGSIQGVMKFRIENSSYENKVIKILRKIFGQ